MVAARESGRAILGKLKKSGIDPVFFLYIAGT